MPDIKFASETLDGLASNRTMEAKTATPIAPGKKGKDKGDKIEVVKILLLMTFSFLLGFALVIIFLKPSSGDKPTATESREQGEELATEQAPSPPPPNSSSYAPPPPSDRQEVEPAPVADSPDDVVEEDEQNLSDQGTVPPTVPPGRTPPGVALDGDGFYIKCWDKEGREHPGNACDRMSTFEKRFATRLYVVDECRKASLGEEATGKLSLGVELDLSSMTLSYWTGPSTEIPGGNKIATCLRTKLAGLPIHGLTHEYDRYRMFFTVLFGNPQGKKQEKPTREVVAKKGTARQVVKDRVRVRKTPIDGEIIGKINSGNQVQFLSQKGDWCQVLTPNNNRGWMICDALSK